MALAERACLGSIPACAGEPPAFSTPMIVPKVYPRVCGGTALAVPATTWPRGLSPRVRGNRRAPGGRLQQ